MADVSYSSGSILFNKKDPATRFYVLKSGEVELFDPDGDRQFSQEVSEVYLPKPREMLFVLRLQPRLFGRCSILAQVL